MKVTITIILVVFSLTAYTQIPKVTGGTVIHFGQFQSRYVQPRDIDVWLPEGYDAAREYAVVYMHDGQMLFDSTINWNKQEWQVDETLTRLLSEKKIRDCIVVGIWNNGAYRHAEYFPQKPLDLLPAALRDTIVQRELMGNPLSDRYLRFITRELMPFIQKKFSASDRRDDTFIIGSSMGGLISLYALCEYPELFGGAGCMSTHWPGSLILYNELIPGTFFTWLNASLPSPGKHRIYFDYGTGTLDSLYKPFQMVVDEIMKRKGYNAASWITKEFPGEDHSERSWSRRFEIPAMFLLQ